MKSDWSNAKDSIVNEKNLTRVNPKHTLVLLPLACVAIHLPTGARNARFATCMPRRYLLTEMLFLAKDIPLQEVKLL